MDLTQLANLGEFVGGVAVLVTLVSRGAGAAKSESDEVSCRTNPSRGERDHREHDELVAQPPMGPSSLRSAEIPKSHGSIEVGSPTSTGYRGTIKCGFTRGW